MKKKYAADLAKAEAEKASADATAKAAGTGEGPALDVPQKSKRNSTRAARGRKSTSTSPAVKKIIRRVRSSQTVKEDLIEPNDAVVDEAGLSDSGDDLFQRTAPAPY
ncbi:MAG: hypothetical protein M1830_002724 [Pleopsidium flavum]|nr:MAG: hypothetical protein M1830_002724 [Pleopsidium flavum]